MFVESRYFMCVQFTFFLLGGTQPVFLTEKNCLIKLLVCWCILNLLLYKNYLAYGRCMQLKANSMYRSSHTILLKVLPIEIDYFATFYHVRYRHVMFRAVGPYVAAP
jgi:hypothetical protein